MTRPIRFSIAGLMGAVLVVALAMAALRSGWQLGAALVLLVASEALCLATVGALCTRGNERAWWLGFAVFGWVTMVLALLPDLNSPFARPWGVMNDLLNALEPYLSKPALRASVPSNTYIDRAMAQRRAVSSLAALVVAALGGVLARSLFGAPTDQPAADPQPPAADAGRPGRRPVLIGLAVLVAYAAVALAGSRRAPGWWAGATLLVTWGLLGLAALGAVQNTGVRRARWLGAALFGMGYLALVSSRSDTLTWPQNATNRFLSSFRPWLPDVPTERLAPTDAVAAANARAVRALEKTVPMHFPEETPLEDVVKYIRAATRSPDGREVPIYIDPVGLLEAEKTPTSPVSLVLDDVPLRTSLRLILRQLGMTYEVRDGLVQITCESESSYDFGELWPAYDDPFLTTGQSLLALVAAGLGGALAPLVGRPGGMRGLDPWTRRVFSAPRRPWG